MVVHVVNPEVGACQYPPPADLHWASHQLGFPWKVDPVEYGLWGGGVVDAH